MILRINVNVRDSDPWPSGGQTNLRLDLERNILYAVYETLNEKRASLKSIEFVKGKS